MKEEQTKKVDKNKIRKSVSSTVLKPISNILSQQSINFNKTSMARHNRGSTVNFNNLTQRRGSAFNLNLNDPSLLGLRNSVIQLPVNQLNLKLGYDRTVQNIINKNFGNITPIQEDKKWNTMTMTRNANTLQKSSSVFNMGKINKLFGTDMNTTK